MKSIYLVFSILIGMISFASASEYFVNIVEGFGLMEYNNTGLNQTFQVSQTNLTNSTIINIIQGFNFYFSYSNGIVLTKYFLPAPTPTTLSSPIQTPASSPTSTADSEIPPKQKNYKLIWILFGLSIIGVIAGLYHYFNYKFKSKKLNSISKSKLNSGNKI